MSDDLILKVNLECAVPMWIDKVRRMDDRTRRLRRTFCADYVAEHGDELLFKVKRPGRTGEAFNRLAEGLALVAFSPGGVRAFGHHWEATTCGTETTTSGPRGPELHTCRLEAGHRGDWHEDLLCGWLGKGGSP